MKEHIFICKDGTKIEAKNFGIFFLSKINEQELTEKEIFMQPNITRKELELFLKGEYPAYPLTDRSLLTQYCDLIGLSIIEYQKAYASFIKNGIDSIIFVTEEKKEEPIPEDNNEPSLEEALGDLANDPEVIRRYLIVTTAIKRGNKPTAREFNTHPASIRKLRKKFEEFGVDGLK